MFFTQKSRTFEGFSSTILIYSMTILSLLVVVLAQHHKTGNATNMILWEVLYT